ncbi:MAG: hypothetical protein JWR69_1423 [Pedosphaera sp.]|nr:hypothetical protein [Pedosphaera sp.]
MKIRNMLTVSLLLVLLGTQAVLAEDVYYHVRFGDLTFTEGALPKETSSSWESRQWRTAEAMQPYAVLDGAGEVFLAGEAADRWTPPVQVYQQGILAIRAPKDKEVTGRLFVPKPDFSGMTALTFKIPLTAGKPEAGKEFLKAKETHYRKLLDRNIPGGAWFRHQEQEAANAGTGKAVADPAGTGRFNRRRPLEVEDTYDLFTGGRAVSENLQLDRVLLATKPGEATVDLTNVIGITVKEMDWKPLIKDCKPELDPLAASVPADQHALFFPSFQAMTEMMDEADNNCTPLLQMIEPRSEDMDSRGRYQKQLCLGLSEISRRLGPQMVESVAFTGSDPYLRTGTDIGVLFQTKQPDVVKGFILARQAATAQAGSLAKGVHGEIDGVGYTGLVSPDRAVCSYVASVGEVVFVSNSLYQLGRLIQVNKGSQPALVTQDEYIFFRNRYPRGDKQESAFLVLSDAAIRRWCSPQWRIATARRTRAAAALAELQAAQLDALVKGTVQPGPLPTDLQLADAGQFGVTGQGVTSAVYGTLDFLTPIGEIPMTKVTQAEADAYNRWREGYQQNWSQYFDPIAARFSVHPEQISAELTVMPLIVRTEYNQLIRLSSGAAIAPASGDPHPGVLAHLAMAINPQSEPILQAGNFVGTMSPSLKANPFGWLGSSIALYADEDPFWEKLAHAEKPEAFLEKEYHQLPLALHCEVKSPLGMVAFLTALRAYSDQSAPGMTTWASHEYGGQNYVKVTPAGEFREQDGLEKLAIYYAVTPESLVVTLNESLLKRALDRQAARKAARAEGKTIPAANLPWLGTNLCLQLDQRFITALQRVLGEEYQAAQQLLAWNNLPILNEWKRRFPTQDPVRLHEQFWQTKLVCPGGGKYVWNEKWRTMESTIYGHPGEPKKGPAKFGPLSSVACANLGVSFENQGLSAKAVFNRTTKQP